MIDEYIESKEKTKKIATKQEKRIERGEMEKFQASVTGPGFFAGGSIHLELSSKMKNKGGGGRKVLTSPFAPTPSPQSLMIIHGLKICKKNLYFIFMMQGVYDHYITP